MKPIGYALPQAVTVPQPLVAESLHFEEYRGAILHDCVDTGEALVSVFDNMGEADCFGEQLVRGLSRRLEHNHGTLFGGSFGERQCCAGKTVQEEHRSILERWRDCFHHCSGDGP